MDLPYPSRPNLEPIEPFSNMANRLDKRMRSTMWSMKDIGRHQQNLPSGLRNRLIRLIERDRSKQLSQKLISSDVHPETQIGVKGSRWALIHYCARWNAVDCLEYLLRWKYKNEPSDYSQMINAKTVEGYTPLMVSILYDSKVFLQTLLEYGGLDIFIINSNKLTAYQLAVSNKNQLAIKLLIEYEHASKHTNCLNVTKLTQEHKFKKQDYESCCCCTIFTRLCQWILPDPKNKQLFQRQNSLIIQAPVTTERGSLMSNVKMEEGFGKNLKSICTNPATLENYQISWTRASELSSRNMQLYDNFNPFQTKQLNFTLKHQLTVMQCLARHPWLVRKTIKRCQKQMYKVSMYPKGYHQTIQIDDYVPCLKDKKQPMFLGNQKQLWPMLLQKALVSCHGSYITNESLTPKMMLEQLTGCPTQTFLLSQIEGNLFDHLKSLTQAGYLVALTTRQTSRLQEEGQGSQSFAILNFYEKEQKRLYLVNCPFILPRWKDKDKNEPLALRLLKAHYNNHNQMSIWFDEAKLKENFENFTVCFINQHHQRSELKAYCKQYLFFKFQAHDQSEYTFKLTEWVDGKQIPLHVNMDKLEVSFNDLPAQSHLISHKPSLGRVQCLSVQEGEYLCKVSLESPEIMKNLVLAVHGINRFSLECLDQEIGKIEWMYILKEKILIQGKFEKIEGQLQRAIERCGNYWIIVLRKDEEEKVLSIQEIAKEEKEELQEKEEKQEKDNVQEKEENQNPNLAKSATNSISSSPKRKSRFFMSYQEDLIVQIIQGFKDSNNQIKFQELDPVHSYTIFKTADKIDLTAMAAKFFCN